jgi:hypothetical protein
VSADGALAACRRVEAGAWRTKTDRAGVPVYLHRLDGAARQSSAPPAAPGGPAHQRADADTLHAVYSALLAALPLAQRHREALRQRGLSDAEFDCRGYGSLPVQGRARVAREPYERWGGAVLRVPGIITCERDGRRYLSLAGAAGLLVPVRDPVGRVVALLVRRDGDDCTGPRYCYLSSTRHGGSGPGAPAHVPIGVVAPAEVVRVTEGVLKADVTAALSGVPTVGAAGLAWRPVLSILRELGARTVRLALDADARDKPPVARALAACAQALTAEGYTVELERWPAPHKGIDDALAAGAAVEVLAGDEARQAIADIVAEGTAGEPPQEPGPLDRLADVLADGPEALFRDAELLRALAQLAEADPPEYACHRARLRAAGVRLRELDAVLAQFRREIRAAQPPPDAAGAYRIVAGRVVHVRPTPQGPVEVPLANWSGRIVEEVVNDDGAERRITFAVEGALADGTPLTRAEVAADSFAWMRWPVEVWGTRAVVLAGASTADHLRVALQLLSGEVPRRTVYGHVGWREVGGRWCYLHGSGAIGADGPAAGVEVSLPDPLTGFTLPVPPTGEALAAAARASLALLEGLAPARIAMPLLAAVWRAVLGQAAGAIDLSLYLVGPHGAGKSEVAALAQQHFGPGLDARHLPGNWASTANSLEGLAFHAKDALLVVDDYAPRGAVGDRQRLEGAADRLLRAQGNHSGRQRMRADGSLRPNRPPRGLILCTGEDLPAGQSLRGRLLVLEIGPGDVELARLTPHQRAAASGLFAQALAGYVAWLAPRYGELRGSLPTQRAALRDRARDEVAGGSPRTPGIVADLALGLELFLNFALDAGAVTSDQRAALEGRGWAALLQAAAAQAAHVQTAEPTALFLRMLAAAVASGRAHVAEPNGMEPNPPQAWGWQGQEYMRKGENGPELELRFVPQGRRVGWVEGENLYLEPEASYAAAQQMARDQGEALPVTPRTLHRRLSERGLLVSREAGRETVTIRKTLEGRRRAVLHLRADALCAQQPDQPDQPDQQGEIPGENGQVAGQVAGRVAPAAGPNPTMKPDQNGRENGPLVGLVGSHNGVSGCPQDDGEESINPPGRGDAWEGDE